MDIIRIATAGSVDDGKSTLIGRLLYETNSVPKDRLEAIDAASKRRGVGFLDLSLLTDGLIAEREQGITIDVAHVYFNTPSRKYIIADTPGHFEYTRNMVTGASRASVSIILIDARNGVVEQTARHYFISALLCVPEVIVCVNKMDLVGYAQARFDDVVADFKRIADRIRPEGQTIRYLPVASLHGDNVTRRSGQLSWYHGPALLELLEQAEAHHPRQFSARLGVQTVIRPRAGHNDSALHDYRGYAGRISSGSFAVGDEIVALPSAEHSHIVAIDKFGQQHERAEAGESITLRLADNIDISRGGLISHTADVPAPCKEVRAHVCWLDHQVLTPGKTHVLQHGVNRVRAKTIAIHGVINVVTQDITHSPPQLKLNEIGTATFKLSAPIFADTYSVNPANGAFILIDEWTNNTVGVGFIEPMPPPIPPADEAFGSGV